MWQMRESTVNFTVMVWTCFCDKLMNLNFNSLLLDKILKYVLSSEGSGQGN